MPLSVDHVCLGVDDLQRGIGTFSALGFDVRSAGDEARMDTETASLVLRPSHAVACSASLGLVGEGGVGRMDERLPLRVLSSVSHEKQTTTHPNGVLRLERVYIAVPELRTAAREYASALRMELPPEQRGNVIKARMCVFDVGWVGITIAEPVEPGPAADALARRGAGLFQLLFRVRELARVAHCLDEHGVPPPERGTRNTGEAAMLVRPGHACGVYVAFVGPA